MKIIKVESLIIFLIALSLIEVSCKKSFFTEANTNPNAPDSSKITPSALLPTVEAALAYTQGGDFARFAGLYDQQFLGYSNQAAAYYRYAVTTADFDSPWGNLFTSVLENAKVMQHIADSGKNNAYSGISRILLAYALQLGVDCWGKIPYSQAFQGNENFHPTYDDDKELYDTIKSLINVGIIQLNDPNPGVLTPSVEDFIYGGNADNWIKFGHAIKARLYIHQSKGNTVMADSALTEVAESFSDGTTNAVYPFKGNTETTANPVYQFNEQRTDIDFGSGAFATYLESLNDPRLNIFLTPDYSDVNGVGIGDYYGSRTAPVEFITYEELSFIQAEAILRSGGGVSNAQTSYQTAIQANMNKLGVSSLDASTYIMANGALSTSIDTAIEEVAFQEYISLFLNPEAWTLWRRTQSPNLTPVSGTNGIPRRFLYPQTEYTLNSANVPIPESGNTSFAPKIFWDN
jgi:hypothetical protein